MILTLLIMTVISFSFRYAPFVFTSWLKKWIFLRKLAATLPICILILLVAHNLEHTSCGTPEIVALAMVILTQAIFRNVLLSIAVGTLFHQLLMRI